jgi:tetratricopeptide (TPR) repeat protein
MQQTLDRAVSRKLDRPETPILRYYFAFLRNDPIGIEQSEALAAGRPEPEPLMLLVHSLALARSGRLRSAGESLRHSVQLCDETNRLEIAALYQSAGADWQALFGRPAEASRIAIDALKKSNGRDVEYSAAVALALSGESSRVHAIVLDLGTRYPEDSSVQYTYLPVLQALLALKSGKPEQAIEAMKVVSGSDYAIPGTAFVATFGGMYSAFVRGQAYLAAGKPDEAKAEFQKVLDHSGIVLVDPIGALARLQIGRAYALSGDKASARASYEDFLTLWKDADPDLPLLKQAKAEYSKL